jgi:endonuclease/exonuclease/phosphatase family metal-dependent hydrolase
MNSMNILKRLLTSALLFTAAATLSAQTSHLVISQVYGGGGNSGAPLTNDFVELYNPTSADISLSGYSIQYTSAAGNTWGSNTLALTGTVISHHYFLIQLAAGAASPMPLPTADQTGPINMSATTGKVFLANTTTPFTTACPIPNANIIDFLGFGGANNGATPAVPCGEGGAPQTTQAGNAMAYIRTDPTTDTDNNSADFSVGAPNPHNSAYTSGGTTTLTLSSAAANPGTVAPGGLTTLSVTVTPGSATKGITSVTADLSGIGGNSAQAFVVSPNTPGVYTYSETVPAATTVNTYSLPVTAKDGDGESASANISLIVQNAATATPIATIQGNRSTYVGTTITTTGIVTVVTSSGAYIQTPSSNPGGSGASDGILLYFGTNKVPTTVVPGTQINVTGSLTLFPAATASHIPSLEVGTPVVTVIATNQPMPTAVALPTPTAGGGIYQLTKYESMLVNAPSLTAVSGTDGFLTENTETYTSNGQFYAVAGSTARPFREPGMDFRDFPATTCPTFANCTATATSAGVARPANLTLFDDNPERLIVESSLGGGTVLNVSTGAVITNATGVLDFSYATDVPYGDPARLILMPGSVTAVTTPGLTVTPLAAPGPNQFTIAAFNIERFFDTNSANDLYYDPVAMTTKKSLAVDVTPAAYARRLKKASLAVRTVLNNPDIISFEEAENVGVLQDIAKQIDADTPMGSTPPGYVAYGTDSSTTFTDDIGGISIGFLIKPATVDFVKFEQMGANSTYVNSTNQTVTLNDRPSDALHAGIKRAAGQKDYPITVISNHLRSLSDVNDDVNVRTKKELQAEMLATLIQGYQANGEHVVAVGDMNVFQFSDGYTDVMGTVTGNVGTNVAAQPGKAIVTPAAVDLVTLLPPTQQQSYVEFGNAQVLDHIVVTADIASSTKLVYAHIDSDFPVIQYNDDSTAAASSDHDPALAYLTLPAAVTTGTLTGTATFPSEPVGTASAGQQFTFTNTGDTPLAVAVAISGDFSQTNTCGTSLAISSSCMINVVFKPTATGARTSTLTVSSNNAVIATTTLTGTGTAAADFTVAGNNGNATVTVAAGANGTLPLTITSTNGFTGSVAFACAVAGTAPAGVACSVNTPITVAAGGTGTATVTFTTTAQVFSSGLGWLPSSTGGRLACVMLLLLSGVALSKLRRGRMALGMLASVLFIVAMGITGCSGSGSSSTGGTKTLVSGTPSGSYAYTVIATSGSTSHTQTVTLVVQ